MSRFAAPGPLQRWVGRPLFWWTAMGLLVGGLLVSGVSRPVPPRLPVLDRVPPTGRGRLVVFGDPACPECVAASSGALRSLSRHLRSVRQGFDLEWIGLGDSVTPPALGPPVLVVDEASRAAPLVAFLARSPERVALRRGERAVLVDPAGKVRALPVLSEPPPRDLLPAITQVINGR